MHIEVESSSTERRILGRGCRTRRRDYTEGAWTLKEEQDSHEPVIIQIPQRRRVRYVVESSRRKPVDHRLLVDCDGLNPIRAVGSCAVPVA